MQQETHEQKFASILNSSVHRTNKGATVLSEAFAACSKARTKRLEASWNKEKRTLSSSSILLQTAALDTVITPRGMRKPRSGPRNLLRRRLRSSSWLAAPCSVTLYGYRIQHQQENLDVFTATATSEPHSLAESSPSRISERKKLLENLVSSFSDFFASSLKVKRTGLVKNCIITEEREIPVWQEPYRVSSKEREAIQRQVDQMLRDDVIAPSGRGHHVSSSLLRKMVPSASASITED